MAEATTPRKSAPRTPEQARDAQRRHQAGRRQPPGRHDGSRPLDPAKLGMAALTLGALGVVFGDIGTSPLYALQTVFGADHHAVRTNAADVYGIISLIVWSVTLVVSVKYVTFIMRADNGGEGGIMALTALVEGITPRRRRTKAVLIVLGIFGASLFYGDGMITPAISVLSAVEGLKVAAPSLGSLVLPIALVVLVMLFAIQRFGTGVVGRLFGPVMALWFGVLGLSGLREIVRDPAVLKALSPTYGVTFFVHRGGVAFIALASVVLAITGAEALYADMGHFGRAPIRRAWFLLVFPALALNYLGQGGLIVRSPKAIDNPFFHLIPGWALIPMVVLATVATVIASQSVISGAFSVTRQAVQLGFLPRLTIRHTSNEEVGQVYAPGVNWALCVAVVALVVGFGSSQNLASAYGVAVTGTFVLNSILFLSVAHFLWRKPPWMIAAGAIAFLTVELAFFSANLTKVAHGGWLPLVIAMAVFVFLTTWRRGRDIVTDKRTREEGDLRAFVTRIRDMEPPLHRVPGCGIFLNANVETTPLALRANVEHNHVLHERVVVVSIESEMVPHISPEERIEIDHVGYPDDGITHVIAHFGFQDEPNVPEVLRLADAQGLEGPIDLERASYYLSKIQIVPTGGSGMPGWRKKLFLGMSHNAANPAEFFGLPGERVVTMGGQISI
ncbi:MAG: potassium transporter Kup [Thermoleophilaceae bacterium]